MSFSYLLLIRLLIFLSEIKAGLKTLLNTAAITGQSKWTHRKGKKVSPCLLGVSNSVNSGLRRNGPPLFSITVSSNLHCHLFSSLAG